MNGNVRFGPDTVWTSSNRAKSISNNQQSTQQFIPNRDGLNYNDYDVDIDRTELFHKIISQYYPSLQLSSLAPDYVGIRPKLYGPQHNIAENKYDKFGRNMTDFIIEGPSQHGISGLVNLYGIESPGLTSSLSIANYVHSILQYN
jgi:L-2-hydroxyglutarate oxidase LhgO